MKVSTSFSNFELVGSFIFEKFECCTLFGFIGAHSIEYRHSSTRMPAHCASTTPSTCAFHQPPATSRSQVAQAESHAEACKVPVLIYLGSEMNASRVQFQILSRSRFRPCAVQAEICARLRLRPMHSMGRQSYRTQKTSKCHTGPDLEWCV